MAWWRNKKLIGSLLSIGIAFIISLIAAGNIFSAWQLRLSDWLHSATQVSNEIIIIGIDDQTLDPSEGLGSPQNWSREIYAQALNNLNQYEPRIVAFDILFLTQRDIQGDQAFVQAINETKHPILLYRSSPKKGDNDPFLHSDVSTSQLPHNIFRSISNVVLGGSNVVLDTDSVVRNYPPGIVEQDDYINSFAFAIAKIYFGFENDPVIPDNPYIYQLGEDQSLKEVPLENRTMIINYFTNFRKNKIPFYDVYKDQYNFFNPELFRDKIVLIGAYSPSFKDSFSTPISSENQMYGVEIHANAIQTILDGRFLRNMTLLEKIALIVILTALSVITFLFTRIRWSVLALIAGLGLYTLAAPMFFNQGLILDLVHPYLAVIIAFVASYMYRYLTEFKEKTALKSAFGKYVSPAVVSEIMKDPHKVELGGEKREVSVIFTDIASFTSISEKLKAESLVALLNEYFEAMSHVIFTHGGTIDKFEGDAIMAFFGAPLPQKDHAVRACAAALDMRHALWKLHEEWKTNSTLPGGEQKPHLEFRCGINTGEAIVGNMGSSQRLEYTIMGDSVNLGSRLEGANKKYGTHLLISEHTYAQVKDHFETREIDTIRVVGKSKPIKIYELLNHKGQLTPKAAQLLTLYNQGLQLYHERKFAHALAKFKTILETYPTDGPSKLYRQRCDVLKDMPPPTEWDGVFDMTEK